LDSGGCGGNGEEDIEFREFQGRMTGHGDWLLSRCHRKPALLPPFSAHDPS